MRDSPGQLRVRNPKLYWRRCSLFGPLALHQRALSRYFASQHESRSVGGGRGFSHLLLPRTSSLLDFFKVQKGGNPAVAQRAGALAHVVRVSLLAFVGDVLDFFVEGGR